MSWYEVALRGAGPFQLVYGRTRVFGRVTTSVHLKPRNDVWFARAQWDVTCRILISTANIALNDGFRQVAVAQAIETFQLINEREPTQAEREQVTRDALEGCDQNGLHAQSIDGVYHHEQQHVLAVASCIAVDRQAGVLRQMLDLMQNAIFATRTAAEQFAAAWTIQFLDRLRVLVDRAGGHEGAAATAALGGFVGAGAAAFGTAFAPPAGMPVAGGPAGPRAGGQAEWDAEQQRLLDSGYVDLAPP
jgi:hypothetical protein